MRVIGGILLGVVLTIVTSFIYSVYLDYQVVKGNVENLVKIEVSRQKALKDAAQTPTSQVAD